MIGMVWSEHCLMFLDFFLYPFSLKTKCLFLLLNTQSPWFFHIASGSVIFSACCHKEAIFTFEQLCIFLWHARKIEVIWNWTLIWAIFVMLSSLACYVNRPHCNPVHFCFWLSEWVFHFIIICEVCASVCVVCVYRQEKRDRKLFLCICYCAWTSLKEMELQCTTGASLKEKRAHTAALREFQIIEQHAKCILSLTLNNQRAFSSAANCDLLATLARFDEN